MVTTRKMVESRLATPRPDHAWFNRVGAPWQQGGGALYRGERLLLLSSRYLAPKISKHWPTSASLAVAERGAVAGVSVTVAGPYRLLTGFPLGSPSLSGEPDC